MKVNQVYRVVANSAFTAHIISSHPPKYDPVPVFVKNCRVVTSSRGQGELLGPSIRGKGVDMPCRIGRTAMSPYDDGRVIVDEGRMPFSGGGS